MVSRTVLLCTRIYDTRAIMRELGELDAVLLEDHGRNAVVVHADGVANVDDSVYVEEVVYVGLSMSLRDYE